MGTVMWGPEIAEVYDQTSASMFDPALLAATVDVLASLAGDGRALELAIGTGRVGLALSARGVPVCGIELSPHMAAQLQAKPGADAVPVTIGDMASTRVEGSFSLVYLVWNTLMNVTTQDEQVEVFRNAAAHLSPGGRFVLELVVPQLQQLPRGERGRVFDLSDDHVGIETFDDLLGQISWSHHWTRVDGTLRQSSAPYRYVWPAELDLMGRLAGFVLEHRWADWQRTEPTSDSTSLVSVYRLPA